MLGERFGQWPWGWEDQPADRVLVYLNLMGVEADIAEATAGLPHDEALILEGDEEG